MILESGYAAAAAAAGFFAYAVRGRGAALFAPSVCHGPRRQKRLALTFDDGPSESTPELLDVLDSCAARCTFFQIGRHVERLAGVSAEVVRRGHEIGNHTYSHSPLYLRHRRFIEDELALCQDAVGRAAGARPALFRAPYGCRWFGLGEAQKRHGLMGVMWTAIAGDWNRDAERVYRRLLRAASPGAILCLHDGRELKPKPDVRNTIEAVRRLLPELNGQGYRLVTVSELLCQKPPSTASSA